MVRRSEVHKSRSLYSMSGGTIVLGHHGKIVFVSMVYLPTRRTETKMQAKPICTVGSAKTATTAVVADDMLDRIMSGRGGMNTDGWVVVGMTGKKRGVDHEAARSLFRFKA